MVAVVVLAGVAGAALLCAAAALLAGGEERQGGLRIAYFANVGHAAPVIAAERGLFAEHVGPGVETRVFDSGPQAIESLFAGSVDAAYVGPGPAINGFLNSEGGSVQILAGAASGGASFVTAPGSQIGGAGDLAGKRIAAPPIGNTQDVSLRTFLAGAGLAPAERGGSVTVYNVANPDVYTLFAKGDVDAAWVAEPWATMLVHDLGGVRLFHEEELWPGGRFASVLLVGNTDRARGDPAAFSGLLEAHRGAVGWISENPGEAREVFNGFVESHLGRPLPDAVLREAFGNIEITGDPLPGSVHSFARQAGELGYLGRGGHDLSGIFYEGPGPGNPV